MPYTKTKSPLNHEYHFTENYWTHFNVYMFIFLFFFLLYVCIYPSVHVVLSSCDIFSVTWMLFCFMILIKLLWLGFLGTLILSFLFAVCVVQCVCIYICIHLFICLFFFVFFLYMYVRCTAIPRRHSFCVRDSMEQMTSNEWQTKMQIRIILPLYWRQEYVNRSIFGIWFLWVTQTWQNGSNKNTLENNDNKLWKK